MTKHVSLLVLSLLTVDIVTLAIPASITATTTSAFEAATFPQIPNSSVVTPINLSEEFISSRNSSAVYTSDQLNIMGRIGALFIVIMIIFGSTGNLMVLVVIVKFPRLKKSYNTFIASLSATDLLFNILIMPFYADSYLNREWRFSMEFCRFHAFFGTTLVMCSSFHVSLIAINRYFLVVHSSWYPKFSKRWVLATQIILVWILAISSVVPGALGWRALVQYTDQISRCTYVRSESKESLDIVFILGFVIPCIIVFFSYALIWMKSRRSKKRLRSYSCNSDHHHHHRHYPQQEMSFLEWLTSKIEPHPNLSHLHQIQGFPLRKGWQTYLFQFRHSLPTALEETNFDEQSSIPLAKINSGRQDILPSESENVANDSPRKAIFTCGEEEAHVETPKVKLERTAEKTQPVVKMETALALRVIKSYVRKKSENDLVKPIKSCSSCPELYDLRKTHFIIPVLVISPDSSNVTNCRRRNIKDFMRDNRYLTPSNEPSISPSDNESPDLSILTRNQDCFGCLKIKKIQEIKTGNDECLCKVRFSVLEDQNDSSLCNEIENPLPQPCAQKESTEESFEGSELEKEKPVLSSNTEIGLILPSKKSQTPPRTDKEVLSKSNAAKRSHPSGNRISDLSCSVLSPISIINSGPELNFPVHHRKQHQRANHTPKKKGDSSEKRRNSHRKRHSTKIILTIFFAFVFTYLPYTVINLADYKGKLSRNWYMITSLGFWAGSCLNPYIYGAMNDQFRSAYCSILNSLVYFVCRKNRTILSVDK